MLAGYGKCDAASICTAANRNSANSNADPAPSERRAHVGYVVSHERPGRFNCTIWEFDRTISYLADETE